MGHANFENISKAFVDLLVKQRVVTIRGIVNHLEAKGEVVEGSKGEYKRAMLGMACEEVLAFLLVPRGTTERTPERKKAPVVEPVEPLTRRQEELLKQFCEGKTSGWDSGDDGEGGAYGEFDQIPFRRTKPWAKIPKNRIPLLTIFEN